MKAISTPFPLPTPAKRTRLKITEAGELGICSEVGEVLARHRVLLGRGERSGQAEHYRGLATPTPRGEKASTSQQTKGWLIRRCSGMPQSSKCARLRSMISSSGRCHHERSPL